MLYNNQIFSINEFLLVSDLEDSSICKLIKIIPREGIQQAPNYWPSIEVQWYYKKNDINRVKNGLTAVKKFNSISEFEIFSSEHRDIIYIESIISKCNVYSFAEYEALESYSENTFFSRAGYDPAKQLLIPSFDKWEKSCKCMLPLNPEQLYISCEKCGKWFHPSCCGINEEELNNIQFICQKCLKNA